MFHCVDSREGAESLRGVCVEVWAPSQLSRNGSGSSEEAGNNQSSTCDMIDIIFQLSDKEAAGDPQ